MSEHLIPVRRTRRRTQPGRIALVSMPFGPAFTPSIALGLLASELRNAGYETETHYFTINFAKKIGVPLYGLISSGAPETSLLLGDWLFRDALFGRADPRDDLAYLALVARKLESEPSAEDRSRRWRTLSDLQTDLQAVRSCIDEFLDECANAVLARESLLIGFTTVFQQNVASLALARKIKQRRPAATIVFGGANCESIMGTQLLESFQTIDYVVSGEGEVALLQLADRLATRSVAAPPLATTREHDRAVVTGASAVDLDALAYPEYAQYFEQVASVPEVDARARILFESSRGCWWGQRSHCTFCGLNGTSMAFRSKEANRAFTELRWLASTYPGRAISVVDNILDLKYFDTFVPMLQRDPMQVELFYEVKANLKKRQLQQLQRANIRRIQPGIESLHDSVLGIMKKGVSALQNIQLLKWSLELGIDPLWNLLSGFPGEDPAWYSELAALIPRLHHLPPPDSLSQVRLDRFSPLFNDEGLGATNKRPFGAYDHVYAELEDKARFNIAYHFEFDYRDIRDVQAYTGEARRRVQEWRESFPHCAFFSMMVGDQMVLFDLRHRVHVNIVLLNAIDAKLYRICDQMQTAESAHMALGDPAVTRAECAQRLQTLCDSGVVLGMRGKYLALAIEMNELVPGVVPLERLQQYLAQNNTSDDPRMSQVIVGTLNQN